jgi:hypothetical protein
MMRITLFAAAGAVLLFILTFELTRRRRLSEKYSILWFATAIAIFLIALIPGLLDFIADALGIAYPPSALLLVAFAFVLLLILHMSTIISRLASQNTELAQASALLEERVRRLEAADSSGRDSAPDLD